MVRRFRDTYVQAIAGGRQLIAEYYQTAPSVVAAIERLPSPADWHQRICWQLVAPTVRLNEAGRQEEALALYRRYVEMLGTEVFLSLASEAPRPC